MSNETKMVVTPNAKLRTYLEIIIPLTLPSLLILLRIIDYPIYAVLSVLGFCLVGLFIWKEKFVSQVSWIGDYKESIKANLRVFLIGLIVFILFRLSGQPSLKDQLFQADSQSLSAIIEVVYIFIVCPLQELVFRAWTYFKLQKLGHSQLIITLFSAAVYSFQHTFYFYVDGFSANFWLITIGTFCLGIAWMSDYFKNRSLAGISFGHIAIGTLF